MKRRFFLLVIILTISVVWAVRIKDIATIEGVRGNHLIGYGLVAGLNDTGDDKSTKYTFQTVANMLRKMGITVDPNKIDMDNVAAVMVTAELPPFAKPGQKFDVLVSSLGNADSLQGGTLLLTPLKGMDGKIYAIAQGPVTIGGFSMSTGGNKAQKNFPTVGRVVNGATVEVEPPIDFYTKKKITLLLNNPDFNTAQEIVNKISLFFKVNNYNVIPKAIDSATIIIPIPEKYINNPVPLIAEIGKIDVIPDTPACVVIDERTGTIVIGENVKISTVAVAHGNLEVTIKSKIGVSQPQPFSETGTTVKVNQKKLKVKEEKKRLILLKEGASLKDLVNALNAIGATPRDLISILQAMKEAGALHAELKLM